MFFFPMRRLSDRLLYHRSLERFIPLLFLFLDSSFSIDVMKKQNPGKNSGMSVQLLFENPLTNSRNRYHRKDDEKGEEEEEEEEEGKRIGELENFSFT